MAGGNAMDAVGDGAVERRLKMRVAREVSVGVPASSCQTLAPLAQTA
ncbi:MAG: hypothetical protein ACLS3M_07340 [Collinsella sp.]